MNTNRLCHWGSSVGFRSSVPGTGGRDKMPVSYMGAGGGNGGTNGSLFLVLSPGRTSRWCSHWWVTEDMGGGGATGAVWV